MQANAGAHSAFARTVRHTQQQYLDLHITGLGYLLDQNSAAAQKRCNLGLRKAGLVQGHAGKGVKIS